MTEPLLIIGASVRAAAFSALRAGMTPRCVDLFADADLAARCETVAVRDYPDELLTAADRMSDAPWMYTGGLENYPKQVARLSSRRRLLGNNSKCLDKVRDPILLTRALCGAGFDVPDVAASPDGLPRDGTWLVKRRDRSGGEHVRRWDERRMLPAEAQRHYWQAFVEGLPASAAYVMAEGRAALLGITRQLVGRTDGDSKEGFCYLGSVGPIELEAAALDEVTRLGEFLAERFELVGLVGVDFVLDGRRVRPIEVNPRYTASMEVLERSCDFSAVGLHRDACLDGRLPSTSPRACGVYEKRILFASCPFTVDEQLTSQLLDMVASSALPGVADIPYAGTKIERGHPIVTLLTPSDGGERRAVRSLFERYNVSFA